MHHPATSGTDEPLLAWPGIDDLRETLPLSALFVLIFYVFYGTASVVTGLHDVRLHIHFHFEQYLPFVPAFALVYLSLNVMLALAPFILRTRQAFLPLFLTMSVETILASLCFVLLPVADGDTPVLASGFWGNVFLFADVVNLDYNNIPSLHVAFAFTAALAFRQRCGPVGTMLFYSWAVTIALSTLLTHQHNILDVITGIALAGIVMRVVYPKAAAAVTVSSIQRGHKLLENL
jgi:membrane-associated phospholipid phosphatase